MNNEEPEMTPAANIQVGTTGHKLPEQAKVAVCNVPRGISMANLLFQWQPMGIRVVVNLPFTGDDSDFMFLIRNGPFIPRWDKVYDDRYRYYGHVNPSDPSFPLPTDKGLCSYAWNNMRNVFHAFKEKKDFPKDFPITITQYDYPPPIATFAQCFRRWRGDMQYRIRTVAGFATQGYLIAMPIKNAWMPIGVYDEYKTVPVITSQDSSYRENMLNSYIMADTSMFRHLEITYPFEYPVHYYDQFMWMARRYSPVPYAAYDSSKENQIQSDPIQLEPHGDNFIAFGLRGNLAATQAGAQIEFELEYRCVEGFQFADPALVPYQFTLSQNFTGHPDPKVKRIPDPKMESDGITKPKQKSSESLLSAMSSLMSSSVPVTSENVEPPTQILEKVTPAPPMEEQVAPRISAGNRHRHRHTTTTTTESPDVVEWRAMQSAREQLRKQQQEAALAYDRSQGRQIREVSEDRETRSLGRRDKEFSY